VQLAPRSRKGGKPSNTNKPDRITTSTYLLLPVRSMLARSDQELRLTQALLAVRSALPPNQCAATNTRVSGIAMLRVFGLQKLALAAWKIRLRPIQRRISAAPASTTVLFMTTPPLISGAARLNTRRKVDAAKSAIGVLPPGCRAKSQRNCAH
jgi:hypothetical protein